MPTLTPSPQPLAPELPAPGSVHPFPTIVGPGRDAERELVEHLAWLFCWADVQKLSLHDALDQAEELFIGLADPAVAAEEIVAEEIEVEVYAE